MEWIAIIMIGVPGFFSADIKVLAQVEMQTRAACSAFANNFVQKSSPQFGVVCVSTETGETFATVGLKK